MSTVKLRSGDDSLTLSGNIAPKFSNDLTQDYFGFALDNPAYGVTTREYPTAEINWSATMKETDRDSVFTFYDTTLTRGSKNCTVIDHRRRFLFDCLWDHWSESWQAPNMFNVDYIFKSNSGWTPPTFGVYPGINTGASSIPDHGLDTDSDVALVDGAVEGGDDNIRTNGNSLSCDDTGNSVGASAIVSWSSTSGDASIGMFVQAFSFAITTTENSPVEIINLTDGTSHIKLILRGVDASNVALTAEIKNGGSTAEVRFADTTYPNLDVETWYDIGFSYNALSGYAALYFAESGISSFTQFLFGSTDSTDGIADTWTDTVVPASTTWTSIQLWNIDDTELSGESNILANAFVFDDWFSPYQFDALRRLCYQWNNDPNGTSATTVTRPE